LDIAWEGMILIDKDDFLKNLMEETRAYIFHRKLKKLDDGWIFPVLYREPSFLSNISNKDFAIAMLQDGERDFNIGVTIMREGYFDKAVYHFQQSVEKVVKAILICFGVFKKTHFVGEILIEELKRAELSYNWKEKLMHIAKVSSEVEPEVTWSRYPGIDSDMLWIPYEQYTADDAHEVKEKCEVVISIAKDFVKWWFKL
jgi:HEPN domain-containing protein